MKTSGKENQGADKYFEMLRSSIARAADVTMDLVQISGSMNGKIVLHPEFSRLKKAPASAPKSSTKQRIMVVDDEKMLLILTGELLREAGYEVVTAQSGFECLDLFRISPRKFDLVLLDLNMPLMDGEETFQRLRALRPDLKVMLCTGCVQQERLNHMLEAAFAVSSKSRSARRNTWPACATSSPARSSPTPIPPASFAVVR